MSEAIEGEEGAVIIDDRYAPLVVSTFIGSVSLAEGKWFESKILKLADRHFRRGNRIINIHDATYSARTSPEMRRFWADMSERNEATLDLQLLEGPVVISNSIIRGVMTAVGWLNPKVAKIQTYGTIEKAIAESLVKLSDAGMKAQAPAKGYSLPTEYAHLLSFARAHKTAPAHKNAS
jgi:hypothetical protein